MTYDELNTFIKHYIEQDKTGRAIMLTGPWGIGKSHYIKNTLLPYLSDSENGAHRCIVVSLYGLSSLSEVSRAIYLEARFKSFSAKSEAKAATLLTAKTVLKGVVSKFGFDISVDENDLLTLYESIDLSGVLVILEDVERTSIDILDLLGYINSLTEQDSVKVLLVTNEEELIRFKEIQKEEKEDDITANAILGIAPPSQSSTSKEYTEETKKYLEIKEKTIGDTINFSGNLESAIIDIINVFNNTDLSSFATDLDASDIISIMRNRRSKNLRSIIYACQKTADIYDLIETNSYEEDFLKTIFYSIVSFSLLMHTGADIEWIGLEQFSHELGTLNYPLFRFCYDYIMTQQMDLSLVPLAAESLGKLRLYDSNKTSSDPDLNTLKHFYLSTEEDVKISAERITQRLHDPADISFHDYATVAVCLIQLEHLLDINIDEAKSYLVSNLRGRGDSLSANDLFWYIHGGPTSEEQKEFNELREQMTASLQEKTAFFPGFEYLPEQSRAFYEHVIKQTGMFHDNNAFAKVLDIQRLKTMFSECSSKQMDDIRGAFNAVYRPTNVKQYLSNDLPAIEELLAGIQHLESPQNYDKIQLLQIDWFISNLEEIKSRLS